MTNKSDEIKLKDFRCPYCGSPVVSSWNLDTTGLVYCKNKCKEGKFLMDPEDCQIVDSVVEGEFLEDIEV